MTKRYRVVPPLEGIHPAKSFVDRIYTEVPSDKPDHPTCYEGERLFTITKLVFLPSEREKHQRKLARPPPSSRSSGPLSHSSTTKCTARFEIRLSSGTAKWQSGGQPSTTCGPSDGETVPNRAATPSAWSCD
jgi:hypothetical protein